MGEWSCPGRQMGYVILEISAVFVVLDNPVTDTAIRK